MESSHREYMDPGPTKHEASGEDKGARASRQSLPAQEPPGAFSWEWTAAIGLRHPRGHCWYWRHWGQESREDVTCSDQAFPAAPVRGRSCKESQKGQCSPVRAHSQASRQLTRAGRSTERRTGQPSGQEGAHLLNAALQGRLPHFYGPGSAHREYTWSVST